MTLQRIKTEDLRNPDPYRTISQSAAKCEHCRNAMNNTAKTRCSYWFERTHLSDGCERGILNFLVAICEAFQCCYKQPIVFCRCASPMLRWRCFRISFCTRSSATYGHTTLGFFSLPQRCIHRLALVMSHIGRYVASHNCFWNRPSIIKSGRRVMIPAANFTAPKTACIRQEWTMANEAKTSTNLSLEVEIFFTIMNYYKWKNLRHDKTNLHNKRCA